MPPDKGIQAPDEFALRFPRLLRRAEVASMLRVSDRTLRKLLKHKMLTGVRIGGSFRYHADDVRKLLQDGWQA
ncbi:helix-turn-helix domain-containing protein [Gemmatimonas groenlandica]|uniref:Helix-turn-helix domain-containing protein n=2 Tax=Gemmatimonas groenlandica TaxID=2732249 RepID=A0A6M4J0V8_9BACT|nr:helix-turn-helix domain-containing protein [Gemmatimonas groenlandica]